MNLWAVLAEITVNIKIKLNNDYFYYCGKNIKI